MVDFYTRELDDVVHQLLPPEIFAEIGIVDTAPSVARRSHAVIEELAAHLVGVLGLAGMKSHHPSPPARVTSYYNQGLGRAHHASGFGKSNTVFDSGVRQRVRRFVPNAPCADANTLPARSHGSTGTGVFFPHAEVYQTRASKSPKNGVKPPRLLRKEAVNAMMTKQRQQHAMPTAMEQKKATAAAFQGCPELLALPQEWTY